MHEAIIDEKTFNLAQEYLSKNPSLPVPTRYRVMNPLAGLVVCGMCGRKMNRKPYKKYPASLMCMGPTCPNVSSPLYLVEKKLLQSLEIWLEKYKLEIKQKEEKGNNLEADAIIESIKNVDNELNTLGKQLNSLHDFLEQGIYSTEVFLERLKILNDKINIVKKSKEELENKLNSISIIEENKKTVIPKVEKVLETYNRLETPKEKNELLKEILHKVIYIKEEGGRWSGNVDNFKLKLYPKLPK